MLQVGNYNIAAINCIKIHNPNPVNRQCNTIFTSNEKQVITVSYSKNKNSGNAIYEIYNLHNQRKIKSLNSIQKGVICDMAMNNIKNALIAIWQNYPTCAWIISIINLVAYSMIRNYRNQLRKFQKNNQFQVYSINDAVKKPLFI